MSNKNRNGVVNKRANKTKQMQFNAKDRTLRVFLRGRPIVHHTPDNYDPEAKGSLPNASLDLAWVYGYRGKDCRNNIFMLPKVPGEDSDELIYFTAAVVVIYNPIKQYQRHYLEHTDDIKCMALHPDPLRFLVATGQVSGHGNGITRAPHIRLWNHNTLETLLVIEDGFERQLLALAFSIQDGGQSLASIDDSSDHVLRVWDWDKADGKSAEKISESKTTKDAVLGMLYNPDNPASIVIYGKNHVIFLTFEKKGRVIKKNGIFGSVEKPKIVTCAAFTPNGDLLTGDSNGTIIGWQKASNHSNFCITNVHKGPIFSLQIDNEGDIITGGGKDGRIVATNPDGEILDETSLPDYVGGARCVVIGKSGTIYVGTTKNSIMKMNFEEEYTTVMQGHFDSLWGIATHSHSDKKNQFLSAGFDGRAILWDSEYHKPVWTKVFEKSLQSCDIHPLENVAAIGTNTGEWFIITLENGDVMHKGMDGKGEPISVVSFSPDGKYLAVGSHDNNVYLYHVPGYRRAGRCHGHSRWRSHMFYLTKKLIWNNKL